MRPQEINVLRLSGALILLVAADLSAAEVQLQSATATLSQQGGWSVGRAVDGTVNSDAGWAIYDFSIGRAESETAVFETANDVGFAEGSILVFQLSQINHNPQHTIGRFRLSVTTDDRSTFADGRSDEGDVMADWMVLTPSIASATDGVLLETQYDSSILARGSNPDHSTYTITALTSLQKITGIRLEVLEDPSLPFSGPGRYPENGNFVLSELTVNIMPVPEPSSLALLSSVAVVALVAWKLRRGKRAA